MMLGEDCYCVIMTGGLGTRLWPLSRKGQPKQFIDFLGDGSTLLKRTYYQCACRLFHKENIFVATNIEYCQEVSDQLPDMDPRQIIREPAIRGSAPCTIMTAMNIETLNPNAKVLMLPSDLLIGCVDNFMRSIQRGMDFVANMFLLGSFMKIHPILDINYVMEGVKHSVSERNWKYLPLNEQAIKAGMDLVK